MTSSRPRPPLVELTLVRLREFVREPEAVFWVFVFPILMTCALGLAFRSRSEPPAVVGIASGIDGDAIAATLTKAGGVRTDTSIHLYFDQDVTAFRWVFRINGQPMWGSTISPQNGSNTMSWAVVLDAR